MKSKFLSLKETLADAKKQKLNESLVPCPICDNPDASWRGDEFGQREYMCDDCFEKRNGNEREYGEEPIDEKAFTVEENPMPESRFAESKNRRGRMLNEESMKFKDLAVGQHFDFIDDNKPGYNSFFKTCKKISDKKYEDSDGQVHTVGTGSAKVFHVKEGVEIQTSERRGSKMNSSKSRNNKLNEMFGMEGYEDPRYTEQDPKWNEAVSFIEQELYEDHQEGTPWSEINPEEHVNNICKDEEYDDSIRERLLVYAKQWIDKEIEYTDDYEDAEDFEPSSCANCGESMEDGGGRDEQDPRWCKDCAEDPFLGEATNRGRKLNESEKEYKHKCPECGKSITTGKNSMEDATHEELLCNSCYEESESPKKESKQNRGLKLNESGDHFTTIEEDTPILPTIVADGVYDEMIDDQENYDRDAYVDKLCQIADRLYKANPEFRKKIMSKRGNVGRDTLRMFMKHWLEGYLKTGRWIGEREENKMESKQNRGRKLNEGDDLTDEEFEKFAGRLRKRNDDLTDEESERFESDDSKEDRCPSCGESYSNWIQHEDGTFECPECEYFYDPKEGDDAEEDEDSWKCPDCSSFLARSRDEYKCENCGNAWTGKQLFKYWVGNDDSSMSESSKTRGRKLNETKFKFKFGTDGYKTGDVIQADVVGENTLEWKLKISGSDTVIEVMKDDVQMIRENKQTTTGDTKMNKTDLREKLLERLEKTTEGRKLLSDIESKKSLNEGMYDEYDQSLADDLYDMEEENENVLDEAKKKKGLPPWLEKKGKGKKKADDGDDDEDDKPKKKGKEKKDDDKDDKPKSKKKGLPPWLEKKGGKVIKKDSDVDECGDKMESRQRRGDRLNESEDKDSKKGDPWFKNYYHCEDCDCSWDDEWSSACDDECPECGKDYSPEKSEDIVKESRNARGRRLDENHTGAALRSGVPIIGGADYRSASARYRNYEVTDEMLGGVSDQYGGIRLTNDDIFAEGSYEKNMSDHVGEMFDDEGFVTDMNRLRKPKPATKSKRETLTESFHGFRGEEQTSEEQFDDEMEMYHIDGYDPDEEELIDGPGEHTEFDSDEFEEFGAGVERVKGHIAHSNRMQRKPEVRKLRPDKERSGKFRPRNFQ